MCNAQKEVNPLNVFFPLVQESQPETSKTLISLPVTDITPTLALLRDKNWPYLGPTGTSPRLTARISLGSTALPELQY